MPTNNEKNIDKAFPCDQYELSTKTPHQAIAEFFSAHQGAQNIQESGVDLSSVGLCHGTKIVGSKNLGQTKHATRNAHKIVKENQRKCLSQLHWFAATEIGPRLKYQYEVPGYRLFIRELSGKYEDLQRTEGVWIREDLKGERIEHSFK